MLRAEMLRRFGESPVARLATIGADGLPHLVPIVFALEGGRVFSAVDTKPKRTTALRRLDNIRSNPRVSILVDHYEEDWNALWWVRVDGTARVEHQGAESERGVSLLVAKYPSYARRPPPGPVIVVEIDRVTGWSAQN